MNRKRNIFYVYILGGLECVATPLLMLPFCIFEMSVALSFLIIKTLDRDPHWNQCGSTILSIFYIRRLLVPRLPLLVMLLSVIFLKSLGLLLTMVFVPYGIRPFKSFWIHIRRRNSDQVPYPTFHIILNPDPAPDSDQIPYMTHNQAKLSLAEHVESPVGKEDAPKYCGWSTSQPLKVKLHLAKKS